MTNNSKRKIVSSKLLASGDHWSLSEVEFGLTVLNNAFGKWVVRCAAAAGQNDLSLIEVLSLHNIHMRDQGQRRIDICFVLNIEDTHTVNYALKKLAKQGLISGKKQGKEIFYTTTEKGEKFCQEYQQVREQCLLQDLAVLGKSEEEISALAAMMRTLSGVYDQAARAAASI